MILQHSEGYSFIGAYLLLLLYSAMELLSLFFTEYALKLIVEQTNLYQQQCQAKGLNHPPWFALTVSELETWLGLLLSMGIVKKSGRIAELTLSRGTINAARKGLPKDISKKCPAVKKLKRGESLKRKKDDMLVVTWQNIRPVNLMSNIPGKLHDTPCTRRDKKSGAQIVIPRSDAIQGYNKFMGGVDLSYRRVETYRCDIKSLSWYLQIFFHMFYLSVVQSFILCKQLHPDVKITQRKFTLKLIGELIGGRTYVSKRGRPNLTPAGILHLDSITN